MDQYVAQDAGAQSGYWGSAPGAGAADSSAHEALIAQVKDMQRNDAHAKEQWNAYTDFAGGGRRDPAKHTPEFLSSFITTLQSGQKIPVTDDSNEIGNVVKILQKKSNTFKLVWTQFCKEFGGGTNDPAKHDSAYLVKFFDFISQQAAQSLPGPMTMAMGGGGSAPMSAPVIGGTITGGRGAGGWSGGGGGGGAGRGGQGGWVPTWSGGEKTGNGGWSGGSWGGEPAPKRTKIDAGGGTVIGGMTPSGGGGAQAWGSTGGGGGGGAGTPGTKDYLVSQVKAFQRIGDQQKELWGTYADMYLNGVRDPNRHDAATLEEFCVNHHVPPPPAGGHQGMPPVGPMDPAKEALVMRVKTYQKASREQSELWKTFSGPTCDPARHEAERLQEFINMYNVP